MSTHDANATPLDGRIDILATAPWWLISAGIHVALMLVATLVYIEKFAQVDETAITIHMTPPPPKIDSYLDPQVNPSTTPGVVDNESSEQEEIKEPILFFPKAEIGDHIESNNGDPEHHKVKGVTDIAWGHVAGGGTKGLGGRSGTPGNGIDVLGPGAGAGEGSLYGGRVGGNRDLRIVGHGGDVKTITTTQGALGWLARHQSPDGSWKAAGFTDMCVGAKCAGVGSNDYDTGVTGLALLAYLGAGYTHLAQNGETSDPRNPGKTIRFKDVVKKAIRWLVTNQDADGSVGPKVSKMMYNHAIAALALCEAYAMTESQILKDPAQKAVDFLIAAKKPYGAWRYTPQYENNDVSVTGWCIMALKSAAASGLHVSDTAMHEANAWIDSVTEKNYGKVGYTSLEEAGVQVQDGKNAGYQNHEAMGAVGMMSRIFIDKNRKDPVLEMTAKVLAGDLPVWNQAQKTNDYYYWYYATLALYQYDGPDSGGAGKMWKPWNEAIKNVLPTHQHKHADGCAEGSWDSDDRWGHEGGRVYAVAINALTMEVYCRYENVFGSLNKAKKQQ